MKEPIRRILVIDDSTDVTKPLLRYLSRLGYESIAAGDGKEGLVLVDTFLPDLILLDINMPEMGGLEFQAHLAGRRPAIPIIIITGHGTMRTSIESMRLGAYDYLTKPLDFAEVARVVERYFSEKVLECTTEPSDPAIGRHERFELLGTSKPMVEVFKAIGLIARTEQRASVLILGETGSGKELVARQIHAWGKNNKSPFIAINVTALPDTLIESELFGHEKGAFTGADKQRLGKLEQARDGTLLLDEIGDFSPSLQSKLLRVLQEREFYRLGGSEPIPLRARVVAATHKNLLQMVNGGAFRQDLYFRLSVATVEVPPLRDRKADIPILAKYFLSRQAAEFGDATPNLSQEVIDWLSRQAWPGNVRELENRLYQAMIFKRGGGLTVSLFTKKEAEFRPPEPPVAHQTPLTLDEARRRALEVVDKEFLSSCINRAGGSISDAAKMAGINRESMYRLIRKYEIKPG